MFIQQTFNSVKDVRKARGKIYKISSILMLITLGLLCNHNNLASIARFGGRLNSKQRKLLGFGSKVTCYSNLTIIIRKILPEVLSEALAKIIARLSNIDSKYEVINIDGKSLRGSGKGSEQVKILNAFSNKIRANVESLQIPADSNEITAMISMLNTININGKIITGDAIFTQKDICQTIDQKGGYFVFNVKDNQKNLKREIKQAFDEQEENKFETEVYMEEVDKVHGRIEYRKIEIMDMPWEYNNEWRYIKRIAKISRFRYEVSTKKSSDEVAYLITNLNKDFSAQELLAINRQHWLVENQLHWVKDNVFDEDSSRLKKDNSPHNASKLRDFALFLTASVSEQITATRELFNDSKDLVLRKLVNAKWDF